MTFTQTPSSLTTHIQRFCLSISPTFTPRYLQVLPSEAGLPNECFPNVQQCIGQYGGNLVTGWQIWEWPCVLLEAEFHGIWEMPDGAWVDVTPKSIPCSRILFLPDSSRKFNERQVDNIRKPLRDDQIVLDFVSVARAIYTVMNKGDRAYQKGSISLPAHEIEPLLNAKQFLTEMLQSGKRDHEQCGCGSGRKYKKCCAKTIGKSIHAPSLSKG